MAESPEIRVHVMLPGDFQSPGRTWYHILTFPVTLLNKMQFARNPYKWIRYATGVVVGAQGILSTEKGLQDNVIRNSDLPSKSMDIYYHLSDDERNRMYLIDPRMERTSIISSPPITRRDDFFDLVSARDSGTCVLTEMHTVDAVHLLPHSKGDDYIAECTRNRSRDPEGKDIVTEIDDVRNGILLNPIGHHNIGEAFAFLMTPNFAMTSADIDPSQPGTKLCTAHLFIPGMEEFFGQNVHPKAFSGSVVRMPTSDDSEWPPDILFDIIYGRAILRNFGTQTLRDASIGWDSPVSATCPPDETSPETQIGQKRKHEQIDDRATKRPRPYDDFDTLLLMPYIFMQPESVRVFWREEEEKRREKERSKLEDKISNWEKGVVRANACS